jgi:hypothetical protein
MLAETKTPSVVAGEMMECVLDWQGQTPKEFARQLSAALGTRVRQQKLDAICRGDFETGMSVDFFVALHHITGISLEMLLTGKGDGQETYLCRTFPASVPTNYFSWVVVLHMIQRMEELEWEPEELAAKLAEKGMNWHSRYIAFLVKHASKDRVSKLLRISIDELVILAEAMDQPFVWFLK